MAIDEIVLPITEPETEWVRGRALQKMSPRRKHARLQMRLAIAMDEALAACGEVATEWRFRIAPPGEPRRPLVPDVAFVAYDMLRGRTDDEIEVPDFAPTVAVEVLSPGDDPRDVASKIDVYLRAGSALVIVVDPSSRSLVLHDQSGTRRLGTDDVLEYAALPGMRLALAPFFASALDLPPFK